MKVVVLVKQVYDPATVRVSRSRGVPDTREANLVMNPGDKWALEEALKLKESEQATVVAMSMGPPEAEDVLREALATGADEAILLTDEAFTNVDAAAAVKVVGEAIKKMGEYDLILTGFRAAGDGTGEFAPRLADYLGLPQVIGATELSLSGNTLAARRTLATGYALLEAGLPAVVAVKQGLKLHRYASLPGAIAAYDEHSVEVWGAEDLGLDPEEVAASSRTQVTTTYAGPERERGRVLSGEVDDGVRELLGELRTRGLLSR